ncbi:uncharacterized protein EI90DRAFT_3150384 [Cantharellus anzutake]|uniref:uncharacterized protein n=1 Tax=Cantharellus anzutake TaxID=1750568 RepID=UPI001907F20A|nr:uncharacterized protein EI90DRAFT_3150384 [Cantharellus anzutake]KAF8342346.1 hypothetical protein EI90DRAFT_3150384 [Cantharellus anzutake]
MSSSLFHRRVASSALALTHRQALLRQAATLHNCRTYATTTESKSDPLTPGAAPPPMSGGSVFPWVVGAILLGGGYYYYTGQEQPANKKRIEKDAKVLKKDSKEAFDRGADNAQDKAASSYDQGKRTIQEYKSNAESKASQFQSSATDTQDKVHETYDSAMSKARSAYGAYAAKFNAAEREAWNKLSNAEKEAAIKSSEVKEQSKWWLSRLWPWGEPSKDVKDEAKGVWHTTKTEAQRLKDEPFPKDNK